jgi:aminoglycoside phosphotransferase (APT) family kinase protein
MERAQGKRITWEELPLRVRAAVEERLGGHVVEAQNQQGGFSPGLAARLRTTDGKRIFLKASSPELNPDTPSVHRREARIAAVLPPWAPVSRFLWLYDEGEAGWVALAFVDVEGHLPAHPWQQMELERVVAAIAQMHEALTPCPLDLPSAGSRIATSLSGWVGLKGEGAGLDPWSRRHLDTLTALEQEAPAAAAGNSVIHLDLRADNILLTDDGVVIVDWPGAAVGASWVDMVGMAPSVALEGGPEPAAFFAMHPAARAADPRLVNAVLAAFSGLFTVSALRPAPPGLPTLRPFQTAQGEVARRWLADRLELEWVR